MNPRNLKPKTSRGPEGAELEIGPSAFGVAAIQFRTLSGGRNLRLFTSGPVESGTAGGKTGTGSAGMNRHIVKEARALQERSSDSFLASSLAPIAVRRQAKRRQRGAAGKAANLAG